MRAGELIAETVRRASDSEVGRMNGATEYSPGWVDPRGIAECFVAQYEHKGYGWCSEHGFWSGPLHCPTCGKPLRFEEEAK